MLLELGLVGLMSVGVPDVPNIDKKTSQVRPYAVLSEGVGEYEILGKYETVLSAGRTERSELMIGAGKDWYEAGVFVDSVVGAGNGLNQAVYLKVKMQFGK